MYRIIETEKLYKYEELCKKSKEVAQEDYRERYQYAIERKISNKLRKILLDRINKPFIHSKNLSVDYFNNGFVHMRYLDYSYVDYLYPNKFLENLKGYIDESDRKILMWYRDSRRMNYIKTYIELYNYENKKLLGDLRICKKTGYGKVYDKYLHEIEIKYLVETIKKIDDIIIKSIVENTKDLKSVISECEKQQDMELESNIIKRKELYNIKGERSKYKEKDFDETFIVKPNRQVLSTNLKRKSQYEYFIEKLIYEYDELGKNARLRVTDKEGLFLKNGTLTEYKKADFGLKKHTYINNGGVIEVAELQNGNV